MDIDLDAIGQLLALGTGQDLMWSLFLYVIFFLSLITLFLIPDKNMGPTLLMGATIMMAVIAKISLASSDPVLERREFGMMFINIMMGVLPFITAGMIRSGKRKSKAQGPAIIAGLFGMVYFFLFWFFVQRPG